MVVSVEEWILIVWEDQWFCHGLQHEVHRVKGNEVSQDHALLIQNGGHEWPFDFCRLPLRLCCIKISINGVDPRLEIFPRNLPEKDANKMTKLKFLMMQMN